jgi:hypothetical protein
MSKKIVSQVIFHPSGKAEEMVSPEKTKKTHEDNNADEDKRVGEKLPMGLCLGDCINCVFD